MMNPDEEKPTSSTTDNTPPENTGSSDVASGQISKKDEDDDDFFSLFSDIDLEELKKESLATAASSPTPGIILTSAVPTQIIPEAALNFIKNRHVAFAISSPDDDRKATPSLRYANSTGWPILDYGSLLLTGPGEHAYDRDTLTAPARQTVNELVELAVTKGWNKISIEPLFAPAAVPL
ncbi:MAG: hypothetical protein HY939_06930, partial [Gammaproteobacteria bacterium]|nr:hypothetical protein [Gammaproteobacteria bacterium]